MATPRFLEPADLLDSRPPLHPCQCISGMADELWLDTQVSSPWSGERIYIGARLLTEIARAAKVVPLADHERAEKARRSAEEQLASIERQFGEASEREVQLERRLVDAESAATSAAVNVEILERRLKDAQAQLRAVRAPAPVTIGGVLDQVAAVGAAERTPAAAGKARTRS